MIPLKLQPSIISGREILNGKCQILEVNSTNEKKSIFGWFQQSHIRKSDQVQPLFWPLFTVDDDDDDDRHDDDDDESPLCGCWATFDS